MSEYVKYVVLTGAGALDGCVLPDVNLLVNINDLFRGNFKSFKMNKDVPLRMQSVGIRKIVRKMRFCAVSDI